MGVSSDEGIGYGGLCPFDVGRTGAPGERVPIASAAEGVAEDDCIRGDSTGVAIAGAGDVSCAGGAGSASDFFFRLGRAKPLRSSSTVSFRLVVSALRRRQ